MPAKYDVDLTTVTMVTNHLGDVIISSAESSHLYLVSATGDVSKVELGSTVTAADIAMDGNLVLCYADGTFAMYSHKTLLNLTGQERDQALGKCIILKSNLFENDYYYILKNM